jgi:hypothetical protein
LGREKGLSRLLELLLFPWLALWMLALIVSALRISFHLVSALWNPVWLGA